MEHQDPGVVSLASASALSPEDRAALGLRKRDKLLKYAQHGARLTAVATHRIVTRTLWWGAWGAVVGLLAFGGLWAAGALQFPWPVAQPWLLAVIGVLSAAAGAGCWGHAGFWRGVGRFVLVVGVEFGWVVHILSALLDKVTALLRKSSRVDRLMDRGEEWVGDLPFERWESLLKQASAAVIGEDHDGSTRLMRWIRTFVVHRIERYLLRIVRKELEAGHGGGVSMTKVREVGLLTAEAQFREGIVGLMNKQLLTMSGLFALLVALPPVCAAVARWWVG